MSSEEVLEVLVFAIVNARKVSFLYKNHEGKTQLYEYVYPHLVGIHKKTENLLLSAFYVPRLLVSESAAEWKTYTVEGILDIELTEETFLPAKSYNPTDSRMKKVLVCIQPNTD